MRLTEVSTSQRTLGSVFALFHEQETLVCIIIHVFRATPSSSPPLLVIRSPLNLARRCSFPSVATSTLLLLRRVLGGLLVACVTGRSRVLTTMLPLLLGRLLCISARFAGGILIAGDALGAVLLGNGTGAGFWLGASFW